MATRHIKKTITLPADLVERLTAATTNLSAFIAQACHEKLLEEERQKREREMIERCRVRYQEDLKTAAEFFEADQEVWDATP